MINDNNIICSTCDEYVSDCKCKVRRVKDLVMISDESKKHLDELQKELSPKGISKTLYSTKKINTGEKNKIEMTVEITPMTFDGVLTCDYCEDKESSYYIELLGMALCKDCRSQIIKDYNEEVMKK